MSADRQTSSIAADRVLVVGCVGSVDAVESPPGPGSPAQQLDAVRRALKRLVRQLLIYRRILAGFQRSGLRASLTSLASRVPPRAAFLRLIVKPRYSHSR